MVRLAEQIDGRAALEAIRSATATLASERESLDALDAAIGDGDHGTTISRAFAMAYESMTKSMTSVPLGPGPVFVKFGHELLNYGGGASGPLYATLFISLGRALGESNVTDTQALAFAFADAELAVASRGGAQPGSATMLDAIDPYVLALAEGARDGLPMVTTLARARDASMVGADRTAEMIPTRGRAAGWAGRAVGHADPGARSFTVLAGALAGSVNPNEN
jgi:phosphoenolpyruvate---glycerone phosphotransferase subunit DhaL